MDNNIKESKLDFGALEDGIRNVQNIVDQAVNSQDYRKLNSSITDMVNATLKQYQKDHPQPAKKATTAVNTEDRYASPRGERIKAAVLFACGVFILWGFGLLFLIAALASSLAGEGGIVWLLLALALIAGGCGCIYRGVSKLGMLRRFKKYVRVLGDKTYCDFETLGKAVGRPVQFVSKDIEKMIQKGWFLEGYVDQKKSCLITSNETYGHYQNLQKSMAQKQAIAQKEEEDKKKLSPEIQEILKKGDEFVKQIRACNDAIPGEEISAKIYQMEKIVDQIFDRVEEHPESVPDLKKLMNYYLPTVIKLLNAYAEMDKQPVQGETILNSKKEIETSLDTVNAAFERLLDTAFQGTALDVSSDIAVLHTLLAQEGLTEQDFK